MRTRRRSKGEAFAERMVCGVCGPIEVEEAGRGWNEGGLTGGGRVEEWRGGARLAWWEEPRSELPV
jgi:hypothetical protein